MPGVAKEACDGRSFNPPVVGSSPTVSQHLFSQHLSASIWLVRVSGTSAVIEEGSPPRTWLPIACTSCSGSIKSASGRCVAGQGPPEPGYRASPDSGWRVAELSAGGGDPTASRRDGPGGIARGQVEGSHAMGVIFSVLLISAILGGYYLLWQLILAQHGPAWRLVREAHIAVVVRRAAYDLDREYEELLRR